MAWPVGQMTMWFVVAAFTTASANPRLMLEMAYENRAAAQRQTKQNKRLLEGMIRRVKEVVGLAALSVGV